MSADVAVPSWCVRGAKVICVTDLDRDTGSDPEGVMTYPVLGAEYTLREVRVRFVTEYMQVMVGVLLEEVKNPVAGGGSASGEEPGWSVSAFAPVVSMKVKRALEQDAPQDRELVDG